MKPKRIAIIASAPFYYHIPLYKKLAESSQIDLTVYYCSDETVRGQDVEKRYDTKGNIVEASELLQGYQYVFLKNYSPWASYLRPPIGLMNFGVYQEIKKGNYDAVILHAWNDPTWWLAFFACRKFKAPVLFMADTNLFASNLKFGFQKYLKKVLLQDILFKRAKGFLTAGKANADLYRYYGVPEKNLVRMNFAWGFEYFLQKRQELRSTRQQIRQELDIKPTDIALLFVGRFSEEKLIPHLLDAYRDVKNPHKKLFLVGDGPQKESIKKQITDLNIKNVVLPGFVSREKIGQFYTACDVLVLPSAQETWGMVINEAMCFGLPIITSDKVGAVADLVKEGYNGYVFPAGDSSELTACMEKLLALPESERLAMGSNSLLMINKWITATDPVSAIIKLLL